MIRFFSGLAGLIMLLFVVSCDQDDSIIGNEVISQGNFELDSISYPVSVRNVVLPPVQTNDLPVYKIGQYNDPIYGRTTYDLLSQLTLSTVDPDLGEDPILDSVVLEIPYFSRDISGGLQEEFALDSVYSPNTSLELRVYESNYFINSFDEDDISEPATFFSDFGSTVEQNLGPLLFEKNDLAISDEPVVLTIRNNEDEVTGTRTLSPRIRVRLDEIQQDFWQQKIFDKAGSVELSSQGAFVDYFRGLYIDVESQSQVSPLAYVDLDQARVILYSTADFLDISDLDEDGDTTDLITLNSSYVINFGRNRINLLSNDYNSSLIQNIEQSNTPDGSENIYLKGGEGTFAILDLFGTADANNNNVADALEEFQSNDWLINEASIEFYVDQSKMAPATAGDEPERIYIYDYVTGEPLLDYSLSVDSSPLNANTNHLGRLVREETSEGALYRVSLTDHITALINDDADDPNDDFPNHPLAIVVSQNVNIVSQNEVKNQGSSNVDRIATGSIISHEGTILHGNLSPDENKRLKLQVYYTKLTN